MSGKFYDFNFKNRYTIERNMPLTFIKKLATISQKDYLSLD